MSPDNRFRWNARYGTGQQRLSSMGGEGRTKHTLRI